MSTLGDETYLRLRKMILDGVLKPGAAIQENALAKTLKVSRTPVREALGRLASEELITRQSGQPPTVRGVSLQDYIEILHMRRLLEVEAAGLAARKPDMTALARLRADVEGLIATDDPADERHMTIDDNVHSSIAEMSGSGLLQRTIQDLRLKTRIFDLGGIPNRFLSSCQEHLVLLDAIASGDTDAARASMTVHIDNVRESILNDLRQLF